MQGLDLARPEDRPTVGQRIGWFTGTLLGGWMFGGAVVGSAGIPMCTLIGFVAGAYRAVTGQPLLEFLSTQGGTQPPSTALLDRGFGTQAPSLPFVGIPLPREIPPAALSSSSGGQKHCGG